MIAELLLALAVGAGSPGASVGPVAPPAVYRIHGYLDRAPDPRQILESAQIGIGPRARTLLIASYQRMDSGDPWLLVHDIGAFRPDFLLRGRWADVARVLDAPPGSRVSGTFRFILGSRSLVINSGDLRVH